MFKALIVPLALLGAGIGVMMLYGLPYYEDVKALRLEQRGYDSALATADEVARVRTELQAKYETFTPVEIAKLSKIIPGRSMMVEDIAEVNRLANMHAVTVDGVEVATAETAVEDNEEPYETLTVKYSFVAGYDSFLAFLEDLERRLRVTDVRSISFSAPEESSFYDIELIAETYWINGN